MKIYLAFRKENNLPPHETIPDYAIGYKHTVYLDLDSNARCETNGEYQWVWNVQINEPDPLGELYRYETLVEIARIANHCRGFEYMLQREVLSGLHQFISKSDYNKGVYDEIVADLRNDLSKSGVNYDDYFKVG